LRDWVTGNPDKLGKDFFQFSESLKHVYWNKSRQDIQRGVKEARARTLGSITPTPEQQSQIDAGKPVTGPSRASLISSFSSPKAVNTQAEYDKLPSGTRYVDKNGNVGVKR
jgi:hypothetical protein